MALAAPLAVLLSALAAGGAAQEHNHHAPVADPARYSRSVIETRIPDVTLVDLDGAPVPLAAELDREGPVVLQFIFTTCSTVCPVLTGTLAASQEKWPGVRLVSISIDPEEDTPARLREYAARFHAGRAGGHWRFLTGRIDDVVTVQKAFGAFRGDKMRHEPLTFLRAAPREPWVQLTGFPSAAELDAEVRRILAP